MRSWSSRNVTDALPAPMDTPPAVRADVQVSFCTVEIEMGPRTYKGDRVVFTHDPDAPLSQMQVACPSLLDWSLVSADFALSTNESGHCNATLSLLVHRRYDYYVYKVISVNIGAATFSWATFLLPPSGSVTQAPRAELCGAHRCARFGAGSAAVAGA